MALSVLPKARGYLKPSFGKLFTNLAPVPEAGHFCICLNHLEAVRACGRALLLLSSRPYTVQDWAKLSHFCLIENVPGLLFKELLDSPHNDCTTVELVDTILLHLWLLPFTGSQRARLLMAFAPSSLHIASSIPMRDS